MLDYQFVDFISKVQKRDAIKKVCESGTFLIKDIRKGYPFCQNGIQKGKRLDLGAEPAHIKL